ncbi:Nucleotidyl transferase AbiEii toxin, Type IV TA system [Parapedobacter luteus]|uniref:Nucleotidyl transferase AbiEii toxin, Type IV TA system n=1 Tax=Parapedobacter luteus TaxID=623280 RepID=A0A1T5CT53_9SPHI|nr:nucleotidyl transferase AbiEii/AbiGii toxin family protein [Parapedobacter luteus]SKB62370.1 Nucleotidyl transferase AbiEii toxin, Type IV TA system [Parapedobacter luteus]
MPNNYLHHRKDFPDLLRILEQEMGIIAQLIEKDYWIMHVLHGLKSRGLNFELKGGTSLSKGYQIIHRFSEDIDIHIHPPADLQVQENPHKIKSSHIQSRKDFYDWLAKHISIDGIISVERDTAFDDERYYRSGGIRLHYESKMEHVAGVKEGILLEVGFDNVAPNHLLNISSWAFDRAQQNTDIKFADNRAIAIACYDPGYTFVEKLQTIATKFRQEQQSGQERPNLMRQYYDVYCLLEQPEVQEFLGTDAYHAHKSIRFPQADLEIPIQENEAFLLRSSAQRDRFRQRYREAASLYYKGQPDFDVLLDRIGQYLHKF